MTLSLFAETAKGIAKSAIEARKMNPEFLKLKEEIDDAVGRSCTNGQFEVEVSFSNLDIAKLVSIDLEKRGFVVKIHENEKVIKTSWF